MIWYKCLRAYKHKFSSSRLVFDEKYPNLLEIFKNSNIVLIILNVY